MALDVPGMETFRVVDGLFTGVVILGGWLWAGMVGYVKELKQELRNDIQRVERDMRQEVKSLHECKDRDRSDLFDALDQLRRYLDEHARRSEERHLEVIKALASKAEITR